MGLFCAFSCFFVAIKFNRNGFQEDPVVRRDAPYFTAVDG